MVTKIELLKIYNVFNRTEFETLEELGAALVNHALKNVFIEQKKREAYLIAENETIE